MYTYKKRPHSGDYDEWCDETRPHLLSTKEWAELMAVPEVRDGCGLEIEETPEAFAEMVYAAKFHFHSGSPGYVGDLYILQGDTLTGDLPLVLLRNDAGGLELAN
jgi:hypothetical protein